MKNQPIIIFGAPRSGTNMLRDILSQHPNLNTWQCDEINPIWKYGNYNHSDELKPNHINEKIRRYINGAFSKISKNNSHIVIEKTCANTLRPEFVYDLFPEARYIFIYRNGYDCALSAKKKKQIRFSMNYQLKKIRYAPIQSFPYLIRDKINSNLWGPNYNKMKDDFSILTELELVSKQWMKCNQHMIDFLNMYPEINCKSINYEEFVSDPQAMILEISSFLKLPNISEFTFQTDHIFSTSIGSSQNILSEYEKRSISKYIDGVNQSLNLEL